MASPSPNSTSPLSSRSSPPRTTLSKNCSSSTLRSSTRLTLMVMSFRRLSSSARPERERGDRGCN
ncbi:coatomer subunit beta-1-like isoform X1 [Iris pallida]|uniref:Coatomer subunit beta-1-like isoform X1 n=1 Tax=Iris pallida TaxID=29817 RepID=A0AAX6G0Z3_IRIPA|nr:coatomer subunit beta-1-like isoform X1 [Iris pallida]KAJ6821998.1 coatomer subunit beta-1-like isoform X1 [Iris pallida]KAJ6824198.1 coatomer subunit beta-1-like isoform X1 [Iris pallida]KAJ6834827.1 coatomer subunit beta-1-like isoform X1 [Iris pallida]